MLGFLGTQLGIVYHDFFGVTDATNVKLFRPRPHVTQAILLF